MRLRYVEGARELIESRPDLIIDKQDKKPINLEEIFQIQRPVHLEIGIGKGRFIYTLAKQNPNINYIGIEKFDSVIVRALEKQLEETLDNLMLLRVDALDLKELFEDNSFERIYLNFSDPWPKERHVKRRLTYKRFLSMYQDLMVPKGELHFKTDNGPLFEYSVESLTEYGMNIIYITKDLHNSDILGNIMTEFEEKFSKKGNPIYKLTATFKEEE